MEPSNKNKPPKALIAVVAVIAFVIIFYIVLTFFFPGLFSGMNTGEVAPVSN
ncbi:hypothetical protein [Halpernia frigidisoli]|uniref:Uncharacterized protein n=1 Tax=Halpernia frigidisoli TaxID=1125876 RepID=A0A1I3EAC0_9FLAO|nr:hypothetical protein [Halpernia frigidisoli]SFH95917.1 hypothetical protein SAMN05443292_0963 [Halpernia frigidisoli]